MAGFDGLPDKRWSLRGITEEGDEAWLIRGISRKLYRCPGCHGEIEIGSEHVVVQYVFRLGGTEHHHWHRRCAEELLVGELRAGAAGRRPPSRAQSKLRAARPPPVRAGGATADVSRRAELALDLRPDRPHLHGAGRPRCCCSRSSSSSRWA